MRLVRRVLIVEDDASLRIALRFALESFGATVIEANDVAEATAVIANAAFDLVVVDFSLPDGTAFAVVERTRHMQPLPLMLAMSGTASPEESFRLSRLGVGAYLQKPFALDDIRAAVMTLVKEPSDLTLAAVGQLGHASLATVQREMKLAMVTQALALAGGNRSVAASLLGVTRQAVQQMVRDLDLPW